MEVIPELSSQASCTFNGAQLKLSLGSIAYCGQPDIIENVDCTLELGFVYALCGPNGVGKSTFARLLTSKQIPGFPNDMTTFYLPVEIMKSKVVCSVTPETYFRQQVTLRCEQLLEQIANIEEKLESDGISESDVEHLALRLGALYDQQEELLGTASIEIRGILEELGFDAAGLTSSLISELSSGWRYKCELASALLCHAELLVLDEPSFLDKKSLEWLMNKIKLVAESGAIVLVISHKQHFLETVTDRVLFINASKQLETYNCGWLSFQEIKSRNVTKSKKEIVKDETKQTNAAKSLNRVKKQLADSEKNHTHRISKLHEDQRFIKGKAKEAKQKGAKSLIAKVKLLKKDVEKLDELRKASMEHARSPIPLQGANWSESQQMLSTTDLTFGYRSDTILLQDISLAVYGRDRIALCGGNGAGKSTLIKLLLGELEPVSGEIHRSSGLRIAYFPQNALQTVLEQHGHETCIEFIQGKQDMTEMEARHHLGCFGLKLSLSMQDVRTLSTGQRTRLYLASVFLPSVSPSLLILDEVENLDTDTSHELLTSLTDFEGAVLCVSHDDEHIFNFKPRQFWTIQNKTVLTSLAEL